MADGGQGERLAGASGSELAMLSSLSIFPFYSQLKKLLHID